MSEDRLSVNQAAEVICECLEEFALEYPAFANLNIDWVKNNIVGQYKNLYAPCSSRDAFRPIVWECLSNMEINEKGVQMTAVVDAFKNRFVPYANDLSQETLDYYRHFKWYSLAAIVISVVALIVSIISLINGSK